MNDYNLLIGVIVVILIVYLITKTQPKTQPPVEQPVDVSKSNEEKMTIDQIKKTANIREVKDGYRTNEKITNFSGISELEHMSIVSRPRRNSPVIGSRRYTDSGRRVLGEQGFITVI